MIYEKYIHPSNHIKKATPAYAGITVHAASTEKQRAEKRGLSVELYRERVAEVSRACIDNPLPAGVWVMPSLASDQKMYGLVRIIGKVTHFDHYGDCDYPEHNPYIFSVQTQKGDVLNVTANWIKNISSVPPKKETQDVPTC